MVLEYTILNGLRVPYQMDLEYVITKCLLCQSKMTFQNTIYFLHPKNYIVLYKNDVRVCHTKMVLESVIPNGIRVCHTNMVI